MEAVFVGIVGGESPFGTLWKRLLYPCVALPISSQQL
jgi:hypothetical protein